MSKLLALALKIVSLKLDNWSMKLHNPTQDIHVRIDDINVALRFNARFPVRGGNWNCIHEKVIDRSSWSGLVRYVEERT